MQPTWKRCRWVVAGLAGLLLVPAIASAQWGTGYGTYYPHGYADSYGYDNRAGGYQLDFYRGYNGYDTFPGRGYGHYGYGYNPYRAYGFNPYAYGGYRDNRGGGWYYDYYDSDRWDDYQDDLEDYYEDRQDYLEDLREERRDRLEDLYDFDD